MSIVNVPHFTVKRTHLIGSGFYGVLDVNNEPFALTAEHPSRHIPFGTYKCFKSYYHAGGYETYEIMVEGRTRILFHCGNLGDVDSVGCVLVAEEFGVLKGRTGILRSKFGFAEFMARTKNVPEFTLEIVDKR
jgi:hypothetical protein